MDAVLVTGVSRRRGIGTAVVQRLRDDGRTVVTAGLSEYDHEQLPGIDEQTVPGLQFDMSDPQAPAALIDAAVERVGPLSALVAVHAFNSGGGLFEMTPELIDRHLNVNVRGTLLLMRAFAEQLGDPPRPGRIVLFTTGQPQNGAIAYAASKGALEWITYSAAAELGPRGVTVNAVNPGPNQTGWMSAEAEHARAQRTPMRRTGQPRDAAALVSFLLSDDAGFITGQMITSDGGQRFADGSWPR